jgi:hypothetical protein
MKKEFKESMMIIKRREKDKLISAKIQKELLKSPVLSGRKKMISLQQPNSPKEQVHFQEKTFSHEKH